MLHDIFFIFWFKIRKINAKVDYLSFLQVDDSVLN